MEMKNYCESIKNLLKSFTGWTDDDIDSLLAMASKYEVDIGKMQQSVLNKLKDENGSSFTAKNIINGNGNHINYHTHNTINYHAAHNSNTLRLFNIWFSRKLCV
jgi:hypothetical protein